MHAVNSVKPWFPSLFPRAAPTLPPSRICQVNTFRNYQTNRPLHPHITSVVTAQENIQDEMNRTIRDAYPIHPFSQNIHLSNVESVMGNYLAMSQGFPLVQSGAYASVFKSFIRKRQEPSEEFFKTFAVAMFLCNDEMGSHHILSNGGNPRLPEILNTQEQSHASLLKMDLRKIFGKPIAPNYSPVTSNYLQDLMDSLGSEDLVEIVASMTAFESHAEHMITALWQRICELYPSLDKDSLEYFRIHVGGDDPAEEYHVQMTERLILETKINVHRYKFIPAVLDHYQRNITWCESICKIVKD